MRRKRVGSSSRDQLDEAKSNHTTLVRWCRGDPCGRPRRGRHQQGEYKIRPYLVRLSIESPTSVVGAPLCGCPGVGRPRRAAPTELRIFHRFTAIWVKMSPLREGTCATPHFSSTHSPRSCNTFLRVLSPSTIHGTPPYVAIWKITSATSSLVAPTLSAAWQCRRSSSWKLRAASAATAHSSRCCCESTSRA